MFYFPILNVAFIAAFGSLVIAIPANKDYVDLLLDVTLPRTPSAKLIAPEWITVPEDFVPPIPMDNLNLSHGFQPPIVERDIINGESRFLFESTDYPFKVMGRVTFNTGPTSGLRCSGVLVGPRHVLTAHHCIGDGTATNGRFAPSYDNGERFGSAGVAGVITDPDFSNYPEGSPCWIKNDYAILILDRRIGDEVGYMFLYDLPNPARFNQPILASCGYPGDKGGSQPYCQLLGTPSGYGGCDTSGPVYTDLDAVGGQSGSAVWEVRADGTFWIWGVISVGFPFNTAIASGDTMLRGIQFARAGWP